MCIVSNEYVLTAAALSYSQMLLVTGSYFWQLPDAVRNFVKLNDLCDLIKTDEGYVSLFLCFIQICGHFSEFCVAGNVIWQLRDVVGNRNLMLVTVSKQL